jgi:hypothetical protein
MCHPHVDCKSELIDIDVDQVLIEARGRSTNCQARPLTYNVRVRARGCGHLSSSPDDRAFGSEVGLV